MLKYGFLSLCNINYETIDKGLILAFVEKWHRDTNIFHLLVGEMTIILDYVFVLLHIPIMGQYSGYVTLDCSLVSTLLVELFEVDLGDATTKLRQCRTHMSD